jgi:hypothetical protein
VSANHRLSAARKGGQAAALILNGGAQALTTPIPSNIVETVKLIRDLGNSSCNNGRVQCNQKDGEAQSHSREAVS